MLRKKCVICEAESFTTLFTLNDYPIVSYAAVLDESTDEFSNSILVNCNTCGTVQIEHLIDPVKLYQYSQNSTENTPTWKEHHRLFANFVSERTDTSLLEIGGNSGCLYRLLKEKISDYTILDLCDSEERPPTVKFIQANCEEFDLSAHSHIALSHIFEHLYTPRTFIENLSKAEVQSVFISIPDMNALSKSRNVALINNAHTVFIGDREIRYLFSQYGYSCAATTAFRRHSLFYHFIHDKSSIPLPLQINMNESSHIKKYLSDFEASIRNMVIDRPSYICPAGHYGQRIYYYIEKYTNYSEHILGFIDNDHTKQGKRVYGTPAYAYSPDVLTTRGDNKISIILYAGPYNTELKTQLNALHSDIEFLDL
jgi:hypothetical protein